MRRYSTGSLSARVFHSVLSIRNPRGLEGAKDADLKQTFVEACQAEGVPVVELQHGVVTNYHMGYSYPYEDKTAC
jgi:hypothetical protein